MAIQDNAYTQWLLKTADDLKVENVGSEQDIISYLLYSGCNQDNNPQSFDIVNEVGDKEWTQDTFYKAADLVLTIKKKE